MEYKALECQEALIKSLRKFRSTLRSDQIVGILLSGGVDTSAIIEANELLCSDKIVIHHAVSVLTKDYPSTDRPYCKLIAEKFDLNHRIIDLPLSEFLKASSMCCEALQSFDGMTLRNSFVIAKGLQVLKELGCTVIITGDGADELFGGYSYMWNLPSNLPTTTTTTTTASSSTIDNISNEDIYEREILWKQKRDSQVYKMSFATSSLGNLYNLTIYSPYLDSEFIQWAVHETTYSDCISDTLYMETEPTSPTDRILHRTGKVCLRLAFPTSPAAYRRKDPIEVGSGCSTANIQTYFATSTNRDQIQVDIDRLWNEDQVKLKDAEHLYYYNIFKQIFLTGIPNKTRFVGVCCINCGYTLKNIDDMFCYVCGAYPAQ